MLRANVSHCNKSSRHREPDPTTRQEYHDKPRLSTTKHSVPHVLCGGVGRVATNRSDLWELGETTGRARRAAVTFPWEVAVFANSAAP